MNLRNVFVVITWLLMLPLMAQTPGEEIDHLLDKGLEHYKQAEYVPSRQLFLKAYTMAEQLGDTSRMIRSLFNRTEILKNQGYLDSALVNYFEAVRLSTLTHDTAREALSYYNISTVFIKQENHEKSLEYVRKAIHNYLLTQDDNRLGNCYVVQGVIKTNLNQLPEAQAALDTALEYFQRAQADLGISYCHGNLGNIYHEMHQPHEALKHYLISLSYKKKLDDKIGMGIVYGNIATQYFNLDDEPKGMAYVDSSNQIGIETENVETVMLNYQRLMEYYTEEGRYKEAQQYAEKYIEQKEKLLKQEAELLASSLEEKHQAEINTIEAQNTIRLLEKENQLHFIKLTLSAVILVLVMVGAGLLYVYQRRAHRAEKESLNKELELKKQELLIFSAHIKSFQELEENVQQQLTTLRPLNEAQQHTLHDIKQLFSSTPRKPETAAIFEKIESINESFLFRLKQKFQDLTQDELHLSSLLLLNMSSKEISEVLFISPKSVDQKRYRLRKKMNVATETDLNAFLRKI